MSDPDAPAPPDAAAGAVSRCYRHPQREALVRCTRCDRPICPECMRPASVGFHCPDDVSMARKTTRTPVTAVGARLRASPPYVTGSLVLANVIVYIVTARQSVGGFSQAYDGSGKLFRAWDLFPPSVHNGQYYRLVTSMFLHASFLHIFSNMLALVIIGPPLERLLGGWRFFAVYMLAGLAGSAAVYTWGQVLTPEVGASGAIFGLFAVALVLVRKLPLDPQWLVAVIVLNFVFTFSVHNISKLGHIGGFVGGGLAALAIAGLPQARQRVTTQAQLFGLAGVAVLVIGLVVARSATF